MVDPRGIAIHYNEKRIVWVDRNDSLPVSSTVRSCNFDGSHYYQESIYRAGVGNQSEVSTNVTDLVIDFSHNNTVLFIDSVRSYDLLLILLLLLFNKYTYMYFSIFNELFLFYFILY